MHNTYILLRNNVESTALELEDLKKTGLLPTDLIWVECQSVCWRHPGEIAELKDLVIDPAAPRPETSESLLEKYSPKVAREVPVQSASLTEKFLQAKDNFLDSDEMVPFVADETPPASVQSKKTGQQNYSAASGMKKKRAAEDTPDIFFPKATSQGKADLLESLMAIPRQKLALYAGLVVAGAIMMFIIMGTGNQSNPVKQPAAPVVASTPAETQEPVPADEPVSEPGSDSTSLPESFSPQNTVATEEAVSPAPAPVQREPQPVKASTPGRKNEPVAKKEVNSEPPPAAKKTIAAEPAREQQAAPVNIHAQLSVKANEYNVAAFGGIRNLVLTLHNQSAHFLDKVAVEVHYLNPEGAIVKTDIVDFKFISPGESSAVAVKKSSRGVKVSTKIISVQSKELAGIQSGSGGNSN